MAARTCLPWLLLLGQILLINEVLSAKLADSGYPMAGANPQRNYQFNRKVLCPDVSGGKSTILNTAWTWPPADFPSQWDSVGSREITLDASGYIYLRGYINVPEAGLQPLVIKIHTSGNSSLTTMVNSVPMEQSVYTHLEDGLFYSANDNATFAWNPDLSLNARIDNVYNSPGESSVAPLGTDYLVKSNDGSDSDPALTFIKVPENTIDTVTNPNFIVGYTNPVLVYKNATHEFPIMVSNTYPANVTSRYYNTELPRETAKAMIDGSEVISITSSSNVQIYRVSAQTGAILEQKDVTLVTGEGVVLNNAARFLYHNRRSFADVNIGDEHALADLYNNAFILHQTPELISQPMFSTVDNVVIGAFYGNNIEFWGLDWDSWAIKMKAIIPQTGDTGIPVFSDDCKMHVVVDQTLYTLEPLPTQNVVPILECIDPDWSGGYFSYENLGQREFQIPAVHDRNFISAMNDTPIVSFQLGHGPVYPLSAFMPLSLENMVYTWQLENYLLSFNSSDPKLYCPTTVNLTIVLRADAPFPAGFNQKVRSAFVTVTGISDSRVTIVTSSKRNVAQSNELETELSVAPDVNNVENSPAQIVTNFATSQQNAFNQEVAAADGAPANVTVSSVTTKPLANQVRGSSSGSPTAPLATPMESNQPQSATESPQAMDRFSLWRKNKRALISSIVFAFVFLLPAVNAEVLADSGYPTMGANAERNYMINRPFLCPEVSGGKTTVLNPAWTFPPNDFVFNILSKEITIDEFGYIYLQGQNGNGEQVLKVDINTGDRFPQAYLTTAFLDPVLTHVKGNKFYMSKTGSTAVINSTTMVELYNYQDAVFGTGPSSFVPWGTNYMIESNINPPDPDVVSIQYYDAINNVFNTNLRTFLVGQPLLAMVYKNDTIVVVGFHPRNGVGNLQTEKWSSQMPESPKRAWIEGDELIVQAFEVVLLKFHMSNGTQIYRKSYNTYQGNYFSASSWLMYYKDQSFSQISVQALENYYVDIVNEVNITGPVQLTLQAQPILSKVDNTLFIAQSSPGFDVEFQGLEWGTWNTKLVGQLDPGISVSGLGQLGTPIIHDNCQAAVVLGDRLYGLKPLPIQNVVPILECYNPNDGRAFFSYNNLESKSFIIPRAFDRNNISPLDVTPVKVFATGRGPAYPLSLQVLLGPEERTYTWTLEEYELTFTVGPSIYCPQNATIVIQLRADYTFPRGFDQVIKSSFVRVTGITDTRVSIVNVKKRDVTQGNTLETELEISPDPSNTEPDPSAVVQTFVSSQQQDFTAEVSKAPDAPPNIETFVTGKEPKTALQGTIPPKAVPLAPPQTETNPISAPVSNQPIKPTSGAVRIICYLSFITLILALC